MDVVRRKRSGPAANAILPGYADLQEIGGGAFATVFRAVEVETGRPVALKILKLDTIHAHLIETFHREIQALAAVSDHPNIVTLYRPSTTADGRPVLVLELCRESLGQQLRVSGPLRAPEVTRIGIKIAGALETAHRNGFLHRDMKPQNILITQFGEPALADFGVAALQASAQMTAGVFGFTTLHAAPEVLEGHHLSPATDVYGLASTMYQLLTGQAPFVTYENEAPASVILRILRDPVRPLRGEHIPIELSDLLEAALSKEPEGRPRSAARFATALQDVEFGQGWPETSFVAWGEEGVALSPAQAERGPMGVLSSGPPAGPSRHGRPTDPGAAGTEPTAGEQYRGGRSNHGVSPGSGERPGSGPGDGPGPRSNLPPLLPPAVPYGSPPPPPPPPPGPVRPSVVVPEPGVRHVVEPADAVRGRHGPDAAPAPHPAPHPAPAPHPRPPSSGAFSVPPAGPAVEERPTFVDPEPAEAMPRGSVYEETIGVPHPVGRTSRPPTGAAGAASTGRGHPVVELPLWAVAALVTAGLVIVAAVLLVAGVI